MKKNTMMRIASLLLVCVLATTCGISGTFAKYVTTADGNDSARVAKWGVIVGVTGSDLFKNEYTNTTNGVTVNSLDDADVVAPGTSSDETTAMTFEVKGQPEVKVNIAFALENVQDVVLKAGTYTDYTKVTGYDVGGNPTYGEFTIADDYNPVKFTLKRNGAAVAGCIDVTLADIKDYLENTATTTVDAETNLDDAFGDYTLTWYWDFDGNDAADTLLGNLAAGIATVAAEKYCLTVSYKLTITATQVD